MAYRATGSTVVEVMARYRDIACAITLRAVSIALDSIPTVHAIFVVCSAILPVAHKNRLSCSRRLVDLVLGLFRKEPCNLLSEKVTDAYPAVNSDSAKSLVDRPPYLASRGDLAYTA